MIISECVQNNNFGCILLINAMKVCYGIFTNFISENIFLKQLTDKRHPIIRLNGIYVILGLRLARYTTINNMYELNI